MTCPHCQSAESDSAAECLKCGFNFDKWRAAQQRAAASASPASAAPGSGSSVASYGSTAPSLGSAAAPEQKSGLGIFVWASLLIAAAGVWLFDKAVVTADSAAPEKAFSGRVTTAAEKPLPNDSWRFEGRVVDMARGTPVKGAKVSFLDFETSQVYEDTTDDEGNYSVDVAIRQTAGYAAHVDHPLYLSRIWPASIMSRDRKSRLRLGLDPPPEQDTKIYRGVSNRKPMTIHFAIFPSYLTDSEKADAGP